MASLTQITWRKRDARAEKRVVNRNKKAKKKLRERAEKEVAL